MWGGDVDVHACAGYDLKIELRVYNDLSSGSVRTANRVSVVFGEISRVFAMSVILKSKLQLRKFLQQ